MRSGEGEEEGVGRRDVGGGERREVGVGTGLNGPFISSDYLAFRTKALSITSRLVTWLVGVENQYTREGFRKNSP